MAQKMVLTLGWIFLIVGILGFIPGITTNGHILGIFEVDIVHNIIHLVTGILALAMAGSEVKAKGFAKIFGIIYAIVALIGLFMPGEMILGLFHSNMADHILHVVVAILFLWAGFAGGKKAMPTPPPAPPPPPPSQPGV